MTRAELLARISSRELTEWMAYERLEPFGQETQYVGPAITTAAIVNVNRRKGTQPVGADKFIPQFDKREQSPGQMVQFAEMMTYAMGGQDNRPEADEDE